jgi:exodeoxyribonuclease V gamma subunit
MLRFHPSNRLESLAAGVAQVMRDAPLPPLAPEAIVVPSSAVGRWLGFELASRLGVAANVRTEFAAAFVWRLIGRVLPDVPETSPLEPEALRWRLAARLAAPRDDVSFAPVSRYLAQGEGLRRFELAAAVAETFDRYLVYRPAWIGAWSRGASLGLGDDEAWQAALWREIAGGLPDAMRADPRERFFRALSRDPGLASRLPRRVQVFAVTALPPLYLDFLRRLATEVGIDVHVHAFNPCRHYWGLIVKRRELARAEAAGTADAAALEVGNALLASLGAHGRAALDALADLDTGDATAYESPGHGSLLAHLQSDILDLVETAGTPAADDDSFALHVCHGPMREVEVLHDQLLDLVTRQRGFDLGGVLVLMPDVDTYAPCIEAVFATAPEGRRMPYSIADRGVAAGEIAGVVRRLIALAGSRMEAEAVIAPLECAAVARRFGIGRGDLETLREWLRDAGVRWGRDESSRAALDLPATRDHTWRAGLERLLLGYALAGDGAHLHAGVLPFDPVEGGAGALAGRLKTYVDAVFALADDMRRPRSVREWRRRLERVLATFFEPDEEEATALMALRAALARIEQHARGADADDDVPLAVMTREWVGAAEQSARGDAFLGHGITFAALRPGRAVPARVVALLGLNDGAYPRQGRAPGFDLAARRPQAGDRIRRDEDRYAFLEALLAARERLWLFHTGRSVRDNEPIPPSPLVAEVLEALRRAFGDAAVNACVVEHPLQPFSRRLFNGGNARCFSYASAWVPAARTQPMAPFLAAPLPEPPADEWTLLRVEDLQRFLRNPARLLLRDRLRVHLEESEGLLPATEPFALGGLERFHVRQQAFARLCEGVDPGQALAVSRAGGALPSGVAGDIVFGEVLADVAPLAARARAAAPVPRIPVDLVIGTHRIVGMVRGGDAFEPAALDPSRRLGAWVRHLVVNAVAAPQATALYAIGGHACYRALPREEAVASLAALVALHRRALCEPLPIFPRSSYAYAECLHAGKSRDDAREAANRVWRSDEPRYRGDDADAYFKLAFRHVETPLDGEFASLAEAICLPMLQRMEAGA